MPTTITTLSSITSLSKKQKPNDISFLITIGVPNKI